MAFLLANPCLNSIAGENQALGYMIHFGPTIGEARQEDLRPEYFQRMSPAREPEPTAPLALTLDQKLHPQLVARLASAAATDDLDVVLTFRDELVWPTPPDRSDAAAWATPLLAGLSPNALRVIERVRELRRPTLERRTAELASMGIEVLETFWIIDGLRARVPASAVVALAEHPDMLQIEPTEKTNRPPDSNPNNDVADAVAYLRTSALANLPLSEGGAFETVSVLDSGVRSTHVLLNNPSPLGVLRDCVNGTSNFCASGSNLNPQDSCNHGTSSAAILAGGGALGVAYRGVDFMRVSSFKVYGSNCLLNTAAVLRAYEGIFAGGGYVLLAEIQEDGFSWGAVATGADNLSFGSGIAVIAVAGNYGPGGGTVASPGRAHQALAVGAYDFQSGVLQSYSGRGPAEDGRIKPDLVMPTNTETANGLTNNGLQVFGGTSGAAPYAAGLAALLYNWWTSAPTVRMPDVGGVYAMMIALGNMTAPINNNFGAGVVRYPVGPTWTVGSTGLDIGAQADLPLQVPPSPEGSVLTAAVWWPELESQSHNDIDLALVDPSGVVRTSGAETTSVWDRVLLSGAQPSGTWKIRLKNNGQRNQRVFFAAFRQ